jgi:Oxidoreductase molybdopterin binding domain
MCGRGTGSFGVSCQCHFNIIYGLHCELHRQDGLHWQAGMVTNDRLERSASGSQASNLNSIPSMRYTRILLQTTSPLRIMPRAVWLASFVSWTSMVLLAGMVFGQAGQAQTPAPATAATSPASAAAPSAAPATLLITGDIPAPITLKAEDLAGMPRQTVTVTEEDGTKVTYEGVSLGEVLIKAGAPLGKQLRGKNLASYVSAKAKDGYQVVFTLAELDPQFANESIVVADKRDGKPLFGYQGPLRLVCANDKAGARSVRMLETLEIVRLRK